MSELRKGQRVHVELHRSHDGTVQEITGGTVYVRTDDDTLHCYRVRSDVEITPAKPASWPPRTGDVWKAGAPRYNGVHYYAAWADDRLELMTPRGGRITVDALLTMDPELVFREES